MKFNYNGYEITIQATKQGTDSAEATEHIGSLIALMAFNSHELNKQKNLVYSADDAFRFAKALAEAIG